PGHAVVSLGALRMGDGAELAVRGRLAYRPGLDGGRGRAVAGSSVVLRQRRRVAGGEALLDDVVIVEVGVVGAVAAPGTPAAQRLFHAAQQYLRLQLLGGLEQREDRFRLPAGGFVDAVAVHHLVHRHRVTPPSGKIVV